MQTSVHLLSIILLCSLIQPTYSSIDEKSLDDWHKELQELTKRFGECDLPKGLISAINDPLSQHKIIAQSIQFRNQAPFQAIGSVITKWITYLATMPTNPENKIWIHRSIPNLPDTCTQEDFSPAKYSFTFTTCTGEACHTNYQASHIVFSKEAAPEDFNSIPCLKALLTYTLTHPTKPQSINTGAFHIHLNENTDEDSFLARHITHIKRGPRCSYMTIEKNRQKIEAGEIGHSIDRSFLVDDQISITDEVDWTNVKQADRTTIKHRT